LTADGDDHTRPQGAAPRVNDRVQTRLAHSTQIETILQQLAQKLSPLPVDQALKLPMLKLVRLDSRELLDDLLELTARPVKPIAPLGRAIRCAGITSTPRVQDFIGRRVKFAITGAGVGDHVTHLSWSTLISATPTSAPLTAFPAAFHPRAGKTSRKPQAVTSTSATHPQEL
jgi:hypothetical protein